MPYIIDADIEKIKFNISEVVQDYLYNISTLKTHNHFFEHADDKTRPDLFSGVGFQIVDSHNRFILDEETFLEGCTRVFLINPIFKLLLDLAEIENDWKYGSTFADPNISNREYELGNFTEFIIKLEDKLIGCRYTSCTYSSNETVIMDIDNEYLLKHAKIPGFSHLDHVDEIWEIDWSDSSTDEQCTHCQSKSGLISLCHAISLNDFFTTIFSLDIFELFLVETRSAIKQAISIIALQVTPQLLPNNMLSFKDSVVDGFTAESVRLFAYTFNEKTSIPSDIALSASDMEIINDAFFCQDYRNAIIGKSDFAQCFVTSEYLYSSIRAGLGIDYTSVVVGYIKAIEQLLYTIYISAFRGENYLTYWDNLRKPQKSCLPYRQNPYWPYKKQEQYAHRIKTGKYAPEFGALTYFLRYYEDANRISDAGKEYIFACLDDFREYDRNLHLHKDNIDCTQYDKVTTIRNNARVCLYYLLGAFKLLDGRTSADEQLGIIDYTFERLYQSIWERRRRLFWVKMNDGYDGLIYYNGELTPMKYDSYGRLQLETLKFIELPTMNEENAFMNEIDSLRLSESYVKEHTLAIQRDQMPIKIIPCMPSRKKVR